MFFLEPPIHHNERALTLKTTAHLSIVGVGPFCRNGAAERPTTLCWCAVCCLAAASKHAPWSCSCSAGAPHNSTYLRSVPAAPICFAPAFQTPPAPPQLRAASNQPPLCRSARAEGPPPGRHGDATLHPVPSKQACCAGHPPPRRPAAAPRAQQHQPPQARPVPALLHGARRRQRRPGRSRGA